MQDIAGSISDTQMFLLAERIKDCMGLSYSREKWKDLQRGIDSAAREFGFEDMQSCVEWLTSSSLTKKQIEILANHLTVGETYFFREKRSFEILEKQILPEIIHSRSKNKKRLKIWSAACATGEEPYSIAMLLSNMIPDLENWNITILATDINSSFLHKALRGVYTDWSFRENLPEFRERYFTKTKEGYYKIHSIFKKMVKFYCLNLVEDIYPSLLNNTNAVDVIFCRNVLMYFVPEIANNVVRKFYSSLMNGGWMIVSPTETMHFQNRHFVTVHFPDVTLYMKDIDGDKITDNFIAKDIPYQKIDDEASIAFHPSVGFANESQLETIPELYIDREVEEVDDSIKYFENKRDAEEPTPGDPYTEALTLYEKGCYVDVENKIQEMLSCDQKNSKAFILLARVYANQGKLTEALECCNMAIEIDKLNPGYHYLCASVLEEKGQIERAVKSLQKALFLDQDFVLAHFAMGNLARKQGRLGESEKHCQNAVQLLQTYRYEDILNESDGVSAGRLLEIIESMMC